MSEYFYTKKEAEKAILVGVALQSENISYNMMCEYLDELAFLAETAGAETVKIFTQNLDKPVTATFVGKGKLEEIKTYVEDNDINLIIFDDELSPTQIRNLEREQYLIVPTSSWIFSPKEPVRQKQKLKLNWHNISTYFLV